MNVGEVVCGLWLVVGGWWLVVAQQEILVQQNIGTLFM